MSWKNVLSILAAGALVGLPFGTLANDRDGRDGDHAKKKKAERDARFEQQLITRYTVIAGSPANATSLVKGLHNDTTVVLTRITTTTTTVPGVQNPPCPSPRFEQPPGCGQTTPPTTTTTEVVETESFDPPTKRMGYKQVAITLAMMEAKLKDLNPSVVAAAPAEIKAVLTGTPNGILTLRAAKKNWHQIARALGFTVHDGKPRPVKGKKHDDDDDDDDDD